MRLLLSSALGLSLVACGGSHTETSGETAADFQEQLQVQLLDAQPGDVIELPEGKFSLNRSLSLTQDGVTIRGAGMDKTILSFAGQVAGAEGLLVTGDQFTIEDLAIEDTIGDALKINEADGVTIRRVRTEWTGGPKTENGAYGMYPVQTTNVLIEDSVAIGASDAGIYVGQSKNVVVRNNRAEKNVAGIEIENTQDADVYGNVTTGNTGGILVFNMPNLSQSGGRVRVYNNEVYTNNYRNFGHPGTPVASIPAGSGIVVSSHDDVEIFENVVRNNRTANVIISSVYSTNYADDSWSDDFDPYPERIHVHDNELEGGGGNSDGAMLQAARVLKFGPTGRFPHVLWDGFAPEDRSHEICIADDEAEVFNADVPNESADPRVETEPHRCSLEPLAAVELAAAL